MIIRRYNSIIIFIVKYFSCSGNWLYYASSKEIYVI